MTIAVPPPARASLLHDTMVMTGRTLLVTLRYPTALFIAVVFPVLLLLLMTASFGTIVLPGQGYRAFVNFGLPLFAVMGVLFSTLGTGATTTIDLQAGFDTRLRTMPVSAAAPLLGRIAADSLRNLMTLVLVVAVGIVMGFRFNTGPASIIGFFVLPLVFALGVVSLVLAAAVRATSAESLTSGLNAGFLLISFLSTGMVSLADLPGWAQPIARGNPVSLLAEAMRVLAHGGPLTRPLLGTLAWAVGLIAVFGPLAVAGYRKRRAARQ
ncbi:ABC transporter permease [Dactylosporangium sp. NPDC005572]|uniref:ABC transporter permease n=1 Tax=Dactylosporangium sp. NPDC005572 TaxID=3156889 RepID=UPI0033ABAC7E